MRHDAVHAVVAAGVDRAAVHADRAAVHACPMVPVVDPVDHANRAEQRIIIIVVIVIVSTATISYGSGCNCNLGYPL